MIILVLDTEQANIVKDAAMAANSLLSLRTGRADPDGLVSKAVALQTRKVNQIFDQLAFPPAPDWNALPELKREQFNAIITNFAQATLDAERVAIYREIFAFVAASRIPETEKEQRNDAGNGPA